MSVSDGLKVGQKVKVKYEEVWNYIFAIVVLEVVKTGEYIGEITHITREDGAPVRFGDISKCVCDNHPFNKADVILD